MFKLELCDRVKLIMPKLTKRQIARQDFVDNQIFVLINSLLPASKRMGWDIELIGNIREAIRRKIVEEAKIVDEKHFYPFIKIR